MDRAPDYGSKAPGFDSGQEHFSWLQAPPWPICKLQLTLLSILASPLLLYPSFPLYFCSGCSRSSSIFVWLILDSFLLAWLCLPNLLRGVHFEMCFLFPDPSAMGQMHFWISTLILTFLSPWDLISGHSICHLFLFVCLSQIQHYFYSHLCHINW